VKQLSEDKRNELYILSMYKNIIVKKSRKGGDVSKLIERLETLQARASNRSILKIVRSNGL
jgi:hypothetical protein|tara:strand:- start:1883 stop:2065 length:183 start_codon:yes stop_codon:yes gene_type:complete